MSRKKAQGIGVYNRPDVPMWMVRVTVVDAHPDCGAHHKVGDTWEQSDVKKETIKGFICPTAFAALYPIIFAMRYGAEFPWSADSDKYEAVCPDPDTPVKFRIERIKGKVWMAAQEKFVDEK
jgi:uncharacterized repeat protein (TIGR04076 family)